MSVACTHFKVLSSVACNCRARARARATTTAIVELVHFVRMMMVLPRRQYTVDDGADVDNDFDYEFYFYALIKMFLQKTKNLYSKRFYVQYSRKIQCWPTVAGI